MWVLVGDQDGLIGRAFLTILLLAAFAGIAILEAGLAPNRPDWLALSSMVSWIVALLVGAVKIWLPEDDQFFTGAERFFQLLLVVGILQLALLHVRLFTPAAQRHVTTFTRIIYIATVVFLGGLVGMLIFFLTFPNTFDYGELYWRIVVALTILAAVGTTLIPLLNALFAPRKPAGARAAVAHGVAAAPAWPTYADGRTPLPVLPDGSPDWNAYYTGHPSAQPPQAPQQALPAARPRSRSRSHPSRLPLSRTRRCSRRLRCRRHPLPTRRPRRSLRSEPRTRARRPRLSGRTRGRRPGANASRRGRAPRRDEVDARRHRDRCRPRGRGADP